MPATDTVPPGGLLSNYNQSVFSEIVAPFLIARKEIRMLVSVAMNKGACVPCEEELDGSVAGASPHKSTLKL